MSRKIDQFIKHLLKGYYVKGPKYMVVTLKETVTMERGGNTTSHTHRASSFSYLVALEIRTMFTGDEPGKKD